MTYDNHKDYLLFIQQKHIFKTTLFFVCLDITLTYNNHKDHVVREMNNRREDLEINRYLISQALN